MLWPWRWYSNQMATPFDYMKAPVVVKEVYLPGSPTISFSTDPKT